MAKIIAYSNQKGGVGKTTTVANLGACLAEKDQRILVVDLDPQGNLTSGLGIDAKESQATSYQLLLHERSPHELIVKTEYENLDIIPSNIDLSAAELDLLDMESGREFMLREALAGCNDLYDYIFIDCPPSLGILTINALSAADTVTIVLQCEYYALEGLSQLMKIIQKVQHSLNNQLVLEGVLLTMFDTKTNLSKQVKEDVTEHFKDKVYSTLIPRNVKLSEAPSFGQPVNVYDPRSSGAKAYTDYAAEFLEKQNG